MDEQVSFLTNKGITSSYIGKSDTSDNDIVHGRCQIVFGSAEKVAGEEKWRKVWQTSLYQDRLYAIVVDEAHTVNQW